MLLALAYINFVIIHQFLLAFGLPIQCRGVGRLAQTTGYPRDADIPVAQHSTSESFNPKRSSSLPQEINKHYFSSYRTTKENKAAIDVQRRDVGSSLALITNNTCVIDNETLKVRCNLDNLLNLDKQLLYPVNESFPVPDVSQYARNDDFTSMESRDNYRSISSLISQSPIQTTILTTGAPPLHYSLSKNKTLEATKSKLLHIPELQCCCRKLENNLFYCVHAENGCEGLNIDDQNPLFNNKNNQGRFKIDETLLKNILNKGKYRTSSTSLTKSFETTPISLVDFLKPLPSQSNGHEVSKKYDAILKVQCDMVRSKIDATAHTHDLLYDFFSSTMPYVENLLNMKMALVGARPFTADLPPKMKFELEDTDRRMESSLKRKDEKNSSEQKVKPLKENAEVHNTSKLVT